MKNFYVLFLATLCSVLLNAQDGSLDPSFGSGGTTIINNPNGDAEILSMIKSGDKLVATGFATVDNKEVISIVRFNLNGSLDTGFGVDGYLNLPLGTANGRATTILEQADGKYIVAGWARYSNKEQYVVLRVLTDGTLDNSFGTDGIATGSFSGSSFAEDEINDARLLSDGKIVVAGKSYNGQNNDGFLACFNTDGSLNQDFASDGYTLIEFNGTPAFELATALVVDDQDNIIVGGRVATGFNSEDALFLQKYNSTGMIDNSFGDNGTVTKALASNVTAGLNTMELDNAGRIVTGGGAFDTDELDNNFFLTRYMPDGTADASFGNNGVVILQRNSNEAIFDLDIRPSGDILAAGSTGGFPSQFALVRLSSAGQQDMTFGNNGWALAQLVFGFNNLRSIFVEDDCVYGGGYVFEDDTWKMALAKFINAGAVATRELPIANMGLVISPNPVHSNFSLSLELKEEAQLSISLVDASGRLIGELLTSQQIGQGEQLLDLSVPEMLPVGQYFVVLNFAEGQIAKPLIKR